MRFNMKRDVFFKSLFSKKIIASLVILQNENVQAHEIGGIALQKKNNKK